MREAVAAERGRCVVARSSIYVTTVGLEDQPDFVNALSRLRPA